MGGWWENQDKVVNLVLTVELRSPRLSPALASGVFRNKKWLAHQMAPNLMGPIFSIGADCSGGNGTIGERRKRTGTNGARTSH